MIKFSFINMISVAVGGALGAILRWSLQILISGNIFSAPAWLILVNSLGCFFAGILIGSSIKHTGDSLLYTFLSVGLLSSLTTFSTLIVEAELLTKTSYLVSVAFIFFSVAIGFTLFKLGLFIQSYL